MGSWWRMPRIHRSAAGVGQQSGVYFSVLMYWDVGKQWSANLPHPQAVRLDPRGSPIRGTILRQHDRGHWIALLVVVHTLYRRCYCRDRLLLDARQIFAIQICGLITAFCCKSTFKICSQSSLGRPD